MAKPEGPPGWYSRGYLPHYDDGQKSQAITYRLADALPASVLGKIEEQNLREEKRREQLEHYLDAGHGSCVLVDPQCAEVVVQGWRHFDRERYQLHAWCVMPNHVHVIITPLNRQVLQDIVQSQKSYTAKAILQRLGDSGSVARGSRKAGGTPALPRRQVWQPDYYDRSFETNGTSKPQ